MSSLPTGTLTFLFTDVAGSTRLWDTQPEAMKQAHARQADLIVASVLAHNGQIVRNRGEGDSTFSVFRSPKDALAAACAFQCALHAETWPTDTPLRVRAALHIGPAELREGDYNSTAVNRCARLRSLAAPGQTLLSQAVADLVQDPLPEAVTLKSLGSHRLKDLQRPEQVFQLCHPALPDDFAPLRSLDTLPTNLPQQVTSFIGREAELQQVTSLLCPDTPSRERLLTLVGPGGAGKTRLAMQAGAELLDAYPDGVWLVELASLSDEGLVAQTVAAALGLAEEPGRTLLQTLQEFLRGKTLLLVIDNSEHLLDACARLAASLLRNCPHIHLLATSREPLNIDGEKIWRIPSLSLPQGRELVSLEALRTSEAGRLFIERAQSVSPGFEATKENADTIARISRRLDGSALALELAAARTRSLSVQQIAERLDDRFHLLTGGSRTALPRQQTLQALIDWSYDLLSEVERTLFRRLAVFVGGWTLEAAEAVVRGPWSVASEQQETLQSKIQNPKSKIEPFDVLDVLASLVDKSLVIADEQNGIVRYRLLETIRQYVKERLEQSGESSVYRHCHLDYYLEMYEAGKDRMRGPEQKEWIAVLDSEHDNLRAALDFCLERPVPDTEHPEAEENEIQTLRLAAAMGEYWNRRGYLSEGRARLASVLARSGPPSLRNHRAMVLNSAGVLAWCQCDFSEARILLEECLSIQRETADLTGVTAALINLANVTKDRGDYDQARTLFEESLTIARQLDHQRYLSIALSGLGGMENEQGRYDSARVLLEECLVIRRKLADPRALAMVYNNLSSAVHAQGDKERALTLQQESVALARDLDDRQHLAVFLVNLGNSLRLRGDRREARNLFEESVELSRQLGDKQNAALGLINLGGLLLDEEDVEAARSLYTEAIQLCREVEEMFVAIYAVQGLASLARVEGEPEHAIRLLGCVQAQRDLLGVVLPPEDRSGIDRTLEQLRETVGESRFEQEWRAGQALDMETVFAEALVPSSS